MKATVRWDFRRARAEKNFKTVRVRAGVKRVGFKKGQME